LYSFGGTLFFSQSFSTFVSFLVLLSGFFLSCGFIILTSKMKNSYVRFSSFALLLFFLLFKNPLFSLTTSGLVANSIFAIVLIFLGFGVIRYRKDVEGSLPVILGVFFLASGLVKLLFVLPFYSSLPLLWEFVKKINLFIDPILGILSAVFFLRVSRMN
jgi:hypothetical protein